MKKMLRQTLIFFLLFFVNSPIHAVERELTSSAQRMLVTLEAKSNLLDETCLDEYAARNKYLKRFNIWAPPTVIVSLPFLWQIIFSDSLASFFAFWFFGVPVSSGITIALELKNTIEYLSNRSVIRVVDSLRLGDVENEYVKKFTNKFRTKFPYSVISNEEIFQEVLRLDQKGSLCNGDLTGSKSRRMRKVLARNKHIYKHLGEL